MDLIKVSITANMVVVEGKFMDTKKSDISNSKTTAAVFISSKNGGSLTT